jgi:hypothetical protein
VKPTDRTKLKELRRRKINLEKEGETASEGTKKPISVKDVGQNW